LIEYIVQYRNVLDQLDEHLTEDFPLWDVIERFDTEQKLTEELEAHQKRVEDKKSGAGQPPAASSTDPSSARPVASPSQ